MKAQEVQIFIQEWDAWNGLNKDIVEVSSVHKVKENLDKHTLGNRLVQAKALALHITNRQYTKTLKTHFKHLAFSNTN